MTDLAQNAAGFLPKTFRLVGKKEITECLKSKK